jgi:putative ribosome biogenesis GTPase RsgA
LPKFSNGIISPNKRLACKSWRQAKQIVEHFWRRWLLEYLPTLTERKKFTKKTRGLMVGDLVLVADKESARGTWSVGQITKVMPGKDGVVRTAIVQT